MAKRELIDSGLSKRHVMRTETGRFLTSSGSGEIKKGEGRSSSATFIKESSSKGGGSYRSAISGRFVTVKEGKSSPRTTVRGVYSMPNGDEIVTVRRDIVDRAIGRKKS